jgi:hypothetical protein
MNRFAVLADEDTDYSPNEEPTVNPEKINKKPTEDYPVLRNLYYPKECTYSLESGSDSPLLQILQSFEYRQSPKFYGYCYSCGCPMHSQNYCPIRRCKQCLQFGHSSKVCPLRRM